MISRPIPPLAQLSLVAGDVPSSGKRAAIAVPTLVQIATDTLREEILWGQIDAGTRIPLIETAARLAMSPIPVREALRNLVAEGLVDLLPQRGFRVRPLSLADLDDVYRVREAIESIAIRMAVPRMDARSLNEAEVSYKGLLDAVYGEQSHLMRLHHQAFHFAIYGQCGSPWLINFGQQLWKHSERYHRLALHYEPSRAMEHERILIACQKGDAELATAELVAHLKRSHSRLRQAIAPRFTVGPAAKRTKK